MIATNTRNRRPRPRRRLPIKVDPDRMQLDVVRDTLHRAQSATWLRRAADWEWAAPRPGDYPGQATREDLAERARRCHARAEACRQHAALLQNIDTGDAFPSDVLDSIQVADW